MRHHHDDDESRPLPTPGQRRDPEDQWFYSGDTSLIKQNRVRYYLQEAWTPEPCSKYPDGEMFSLKLVSKDEVLDEFNVFIPKSQSGHFAIMISELYTDQCFAEELKAFFSERWPGLRLRYFGVQRENS